jgi:hypothetical protein
MARMAGAYSSVLLLVINRQSNVELITSTITMESRLWFICQLACWVENVEFLSIISILNGGQMAAKCRVNVDLCVLPRLIWRLILDPVDVIVVDMVGSRILVGYPSIIMSEMTVTEIVGSTCNRGRVQVYISWARLHCTTLCSLCHLLEFASLLRPKSVRLNAARIGPVVAKSSSDLGSCLSACCVFVLKVLLWVFKKWPIASSSIRIKEVIWTAIYLAVTIY